MSAPDYSSLWIVRLEFDRHPTSVCHVGPFTSEDEAHAWAARGGVGADHALVYALSTPPNKADCALLPERHWWVVSPEHCLYPGNLYGWNPEPPEYGCAAVEVVARTRREARQKAVKTKEFERWVADARGDGHPPFAGLTVTPSTCEHGTCWGCVEVCAECEAQWAAEMEAENNDSSSPSG